MSSFSSSFAQSGGTEAWESGGVDFAAAHFAGAGGEAEVFLVRAGNPQDGQIEFGADVDDLGLVLVAPKKTQTRDSISMLVRWNNSF